MAGRWSERLTDAFDGGPRVGMVALCAAGAAMAAWAGVASLSIGRAFDTMVFLAVGLCVILVGGSLALRIKAVEAICAAALLGCFPGMAGAAIQLVVGVDKAKAAELIRLGVDPGVAIEINLAYFAVGGVLAIWLGARLLKRR